MNISTRCACETYLAALDHSGKKIRGYGPNLIGFYINLGLWIHKELFLLSEVLACSRGLAERQKNLDLWIQQCKSRAFSSVLHKYKLTQKCQTQNSSLFWQVMLKQHLLSFLLLYRSDTKPAGSSRRNITLALHEILIFWLQFFALR